MFSSITHILNIHNFVYEVLLSYIPLTYLEKNLKANYNQKGDKLVSFIKLRKQTKAKCLLLNKFQLSLDCN